MREIKFRAWDEEDQESKIMIYSDGRNREEYQSNYDFTIDKEGKIVCIWMEDYDDSFGYSTTREGKLDNIMQYTGLKDCKGNEIYDGDIITMGDGKVPTSVFWDKKDLQFKFRNIPRNEIYEFSKHSFRFVGEIIGNIYENPEILENFTVKGAVKQNG